MDGTIVSEWAPLSADEIYAGRSLAEWGVEYVRWAYAQTSCDAPEYDQDGSLCDLYQEADSPVFFLAYSPTKRIRTECRIPRGKAVVVPLATFASDDAGFDEPRPEHVLRELAAQVLDTMRDLTLRVDGHVVTRTSDFRIEPTKLTYRVPPAPNWYTCNGYDGVEDITVDPTYFAGYVAVFPPPQPGTHELQYGGVLTLKDNQYAIVTRTRFVVED